MISMFAALGLQGLVTLRNRSQIAYISRISHTHRCETDWGSSERCRSRFPADREVILADIKNEQKPGLSNLLSNAQKSHHSVRDFIEDISKG